MRRILTLLICVLFSVTKLSAQDRTITGKVLDINNKPISGASVTLKGSEKGIIADADGSFSITITPEIKSFKVSSVGYKSQTIQIDAQNLYVIKLVEGANTLDEVIVTGYASQKKSQYAGAASSVEKEDINYVPNASIDQILQGRVPGLLSTVGSGQPGAAARVQIRGAVSITGGNDPLYVVDGMPIEGGVFQSLNPNDFASVIVLKDAIATAQYGNRGSSGVILVTTKKGRAGKTSLSYNGQVGITQAGKSKFDMMNSDELLRFHEILGQQGSGGNLPGWLYSRKNPDNAGLSRRRSETI